MTPESIGRYEIKAELGRGGMATVYRGYDPRFKREVAIKMLPRDSLTDTVSRGRFQREAETIAALDHPAIVPVYDFGEQDEQPYFVMRLMPGGALDERITQGPIPVAEAARIISRIAPALDEAHLKGIVHRDLKPGNILFDQRGDPYISDFGIAKLAEGTVTFTGTNIIGTPAYMSPEQAKGETEIDGRSDIYSLGTILFEMLTGKLPFKADTPIGLALKHITESVPHVRDTNSSLPQECETVIARAMAKERGERFTTAAEMAVALEAAARGEKAPAVYTATPPQSPKPGATSTPLFTAISSPLAKWGVAAAVIIALLLVAAIGLGSQLLAPKPTATNPPVPVESQWVAVVKASGALLRPGPGNQYPQISGHVEGAELILQGRNEDGTWLFVVAPNGREGWVWADSVNLPSSLDVMTLAAKEP